jgi:hypothetical protein
MKKPLSAGDICKVVGGLGRHKSPNLGLIVTIVSSIGEHSVHGRMFHCKGDGIKQLSDGGSYVVTNAADFAGAWLERIEPDASPPNAVKKELENAL